MKTFTISSFFILIFLFLSSMYDSQTLTAIFLHYPFFDFRYFLFVIIQIGWITVLFDMIYSMICCYGLIRIRVSKKQCYFLIMQKTLLYCLYFLTLHFVIFSILHITFPIQLFILNLLIQMICFWIVVLFQKGWTYSYTLMIVFMIIIHLIL